MTSQPDVAASSSHLGPGVTPTRSPRVWPALVLLATFWTAYLVLRWTDVGLSPSYMDFMIVFAGSFLVTLLFAVWWMTASRVPKAERFLVLSAAVLGGIGSAFLADGTAVAFMLMVGLPLVLTVWTLVVIAARKWQPQPRGRVLAAVLFLSWAAFTLIRNDGISGDGQPALRWRWSPTPEEQYIAQLERTGEQGEPPLRRRASGLRPGDWPGFRGPNRDGEVPGLRIATDWDESPPKLLWRRRIGPAWSSAAVVGDRLFTQEQRGERETVVCLDAKSGRTVWTHGDATRHEDGQGGAGPRATPAFADGRVFALGATGILNCLNAATGQSKWSRDITADAGTKVPVWGFSSSPLVVGDVVIVFAGDESSNGRKAFLAYQAASGKPAWSVAAGNMSYGSAQLVGLDGETQLLFASDGGLFAFDPSSGTMLWQFPTPAGHPADPRTIQPRSVGPSGILFDAGPDRGTALIEVAHSNGSWVATERWVSRQLRPAFNDFVVSDSALYGFDRGILTCVDLQTGRRYWKKGRYGSGQVLLLSDQRLLVVVTDDGEVVLVAANPSEHQELGRFQAIEGKTWNHPVIAHGCLYVRNAAEMACFRLRPEQPVEYAVTSDYAP